MPTGEEFSVQVKQMLFRVIDFVESEKDGPIIPLNNVGERLVKMLNISQSSITRLKHELKVLREQAAQQEQQLTEEANQVHCLRSRTTQNTTTKRRASSSSLSPRKVPHRRCSHNVSPTSSSTTDVTLLIPQPITPQKKKHCGHPKILLSDQAKDTIRLEFHKLIEEKVYPTSIKLLTRIHQDFDDFPIQSTNALRVAMKNIGFLYQRTSKVKIALDSEAFVAARARYFQKLQELTKAKARLFYHDETWLNLREVKRYIWTLEGEGRVKKGEGKGTRLAVSALISVDGYHLRSIDIWACTEEHQMNSDRFLSWLDSTCATLRGEIGDKERIAICLDNAPWHNVLTNESIVPKRSSRKEFIQKWLKDRDIEFPKKFVKAQLLELVSANAPPKEFLTDRIAQQYNIEIFRLPFSHCSLNPIELSWNNLKQFVRDQNTTFRQTDVKLLIEQFMASMDKELATSYFHHVHKVEQTFQKADAYMEEEIEPDLQDDNIETDSEDDQDSE